MRRFALTLLLACGTGTGSPPPPDSGTAAMCTFTGGKTGSVPCSFVSATWAQPSNKTIIQVSSTAGASTTVSVEFTIASTPGMNSYSGGISDTECTVGVTEGSRQWAASTVMSIGACTMMLRSVRTTSDTTSMRTYDLHGGFTASVEPDDGMGGTVTVMGSF